MKSRTITALVSLVMCFVLSCTKKAYTTNGETIYRTGKNLRGQTLLDKDHSNITFVKSCQGCHGGEGERNRNCKVQWSYLTNPETVAVPYNDSLFFRFLDDDLKSDGTHAETGVHWKMSTQDKSDLIIFLKTL